MHPCDPAAMLAATAMQASYLPAGNCRVVKDLEAVGQLSGAAAWSARKSTSRTPHDRPSSMCRCTGVTEEGLEPIGRHCSRLGCCGCQTHPKRMQELSQRVYPSMRRCIAVTDEGLEAVGRHCSRLQVLRLYANAGITDVGIKTLAVLRHLEVQCFRRLAMCHPLATHGP